MIQEEMYIKYTENTLSKLGGSYNSNVTQQPVYVNLSKSLVEFDEVHRIQAKNMQNLREYIEKFIMKVLIDDV